MDVTGVLKVKGETQKVTEKMSKREFVITDVSSKFPQHISFQLLQDKCSLIDAYKVGDEIKVHFNLRGREWTSPQGELKHFNSIEAWKIDRVAGANSAPQTSNSASVEDSLPF